MMEELCLNPECILCNHHELKYVGIKDMITDEYDPSSSFYKFIMGESCGKNKFEPRCVEMLKLKPVSIEEYLDNWVMGISDEEDVNYTPEKIGGETNEY